MGYFLPIIWIIWKKNIRKICFKYKFVSDLNLFRWLQQSCSHKQNDVPCMNRKAIWSIGLLVNRSAQHRSGNVWSFCVNIDNNHVPIVWVTCTWCDVLDGWCDMLSMLSAECWDAMWIVHMRDLPWHLGCSIYGGQCCWFNGTHFERRVSECRMSSACLFALTRNGRAVLIVSTFLPSSYFWQIHDLRLWNLFLSCYMFVY